MDILNILFIILQLNDASPILESRKEDTGSLSRNSRFIHSQWRSVKGRQYDRRAFRRLLRHVGYERPPLLTGNLITGFRVKDRSGRAKTHSRNLNNFITGRK